MDADLLSDTFVELADTMIDDFDVIDFLHLLTDRSVMLLGASAAGVGPDWFRAILVPVSPGTGCSAGPTGRLPDA